MKVLFTVAEYFPKISGVPVVTKYLAEELARLGYDVSVVTSKPEGTLDKEEINGVTVFRFNILFSRIKGCYGQKEEYINFIKNFRADILINECSQCITTDLLLPELKNIPSKKILHLHGASGLALKPFKIMRTLKNTVGNTYNYIRFKKYYLKFYQYFKYYDKIVCLSEMDSAKDYVMKYAKEKFTILENAADDEYFMISDNRKEEKRIGEMVSKNEKFLLSIANYNPSKNQKMLLKAFYMANTRDVSLILIGSERNDYSKIIESYNEKLKTKYGDKKVKILYGVDRNLNKFLLKYATAYISSSVHEEYSISIIEAMATRTPFISTDVGNARILPGGIVVKNIKEMSVAIEKIISDSNLNEILGIEGEKYVKNNCTIKKAGERLDIIIKSIIGGNDYV